MAAGAGEALKAEVGGNCKQVLERSCTVGSLVCLERRAHPHMTENTHTIISGSFIRGKNQRCTITSLFSVTYLDKKKIQFFVHPWLEKKTLQKKILLPDH